jgi:hypothetical protein
VKRPIVVLGLRRSGTTIFWRTFRRDARLLCFDEPFNPRLSSVGEVDPKGTWGEFLRLRQGSPEFERRRAPIEPAEELEDGLTAVQSSYLDWLLDQRDAVLCDLVRCSFKVEALHEVAPSAVLVHLHRSPEAFASSHLLPSGGAWRRRLLNRIWRRPSFWHRRRDYNRWRIEELIGRDSSTAFGRRLARHGYDPKIVYAQPAVARLLAYWTIGFEATEHAGRKLYGDRFVSLRFEDFCRDPHAVVTRVYDAAGLAAPDALYDHLRPATGPFRPQDGRWDKFFARMGMEETRELRDR